ncbi:MAG TPA: hypothetical protein VHB20_15905 [Verrucomicrobiae bacterium]|jgi:hypothetical protein|nr:hypothetical protein [Verrucomicrobiae bacterium]
MNIRKLFCIVALGATGVTAETQGQEFRTDVNPALRYYEAFIVGRELAPADKDYLLTNEWRGQTLPERVGTLLASYNNAFQFVRRAGQATVPCDWGIDLSDGAETLLPHLARCRALAQIGQVRVLWDLQTGREAEGSEDLIGLFALARNSSQDGTLIGCLVQFAMEGLVLGSVEANYGRFSPATLQRLAEGFDAAPRAGTCAEAMLKGEKALFSDWLKRKIFEFRQEYPGDEGKVMAKVTALFADMKDESGKNPWMDAITGLKTSEGVLQAAHDSELLVDRAAQVMALPYAAFGEAAKQFQTDVAASGNALAILGMPAILKARAKEFRAQAKFAMFHAAVAYKLHGQEGLQACADPFGQGPFAFERFFFQGVDRGFKLTSALMQDGQREALIFVESDGPGFFTENARLGQPLSK